MNPTQYSENCLPKIESTAVATSSKKYVATDSEQYAIFKKNLVKFISADCWAIVVNDEILYNLYKDKSVKENIQDTLFRNLMINDLDSVFRNAFCKEKDLHMIIYMFYESSEFLVCKYTFVTNTLTLDHMVNMVCHTKTTSTFDNEKVEKTIMNACRNYSNRMLVQEDLNDYHDKYFLFKQELEFQTTSNKEQYDSLKPQIRHIIPYKKGYYDYVAKKGYDSLEKWATDNGKTMEDIVYGRNDIYVISGSPIRKTMTLKELLDTLKPNWNK